MVDTDMRSGLIGIIGPTNSGKSTLLNALVGKKISIVSAKKQTTYRTVRGIVEHPGMQIVYVDTPGLQSYPQKTARLLNRVAKRSVADCEVLVWVFDASSTTLSSQIERMTPEIIRLKATAKRCVCVLNKVDKIAKPTLLPQLERLYALGVFDVVVPLSALKKDNLGALEAVIREKLPVGPSYYPPGSKTDRSDKFLACEIIREKIYQTTRQELPYSVRIEIEHWDEVPADSKVPQIFAVIHVDSASRRGILIGKHGTMLKAIGTAARADIEKLVGRQICLKLHVDVEPGWKNDPAKVKQYLELDS